MIETIEFQFNFKGKGNIPTLPTFPLKLSSHLSRNEIFEKVMNALEKISAPYSLMLEDTVTTETKAKPYYFNPSISGSAYSGQGYTNYNVSSGGLGNYSSEKWRVVGWYDAKYATENVEETDYSSAVNTTTTSVYVGGHVVRSLSKHWNIAILVNDNTVKTDIWQPIDNPDIPENGKRNTARKTAITAGAEWILVPFITEESNGNIALRYKLGGEQHHYVDPKSYQYIQEAFARHTFELVLSRHFKKVDVSFKASAFASSFRETPTKGVTGSTKFNFKLTKNLTLDVSAGVEYSKNRVLSPASTHSSFASLTSDTNNDLTFNGSISLTYKFGNARLYNNEQRFKD